MTPVTTPEACVRHVESVGLCTWRRLPRLAWLPSLEAATPWRAGELTRETWFWKDDLHVARRLYFGLVIAPDVPVFVSLSLLPCLIAAQGGIDARTLHERGRLASNALRVYQHVERHGPTATAALPWPAGSRMLYLAHLQQTFLLAKWDLTGRTRGTYGYRWGLCELAFPESFDRAARLPVREARDRVVSCLRRSDPGATVERAARLCRWEPD